MQWKCRLVAQQRWSRRKRLHGWKAAESSSAPGWCSHTAVFECTATIDTHHYLLSHIRGCFIPDKSQSSPSTHDSGLVFILDVSALYTCTLGEAGCALAFKASWRGTRLSPRDLLHVATTLVRQGEDRGGARSPWCLASVFLAIYTMGFFQVTKKKMLLSRFRITRHVSAAEAFPVPLRNPALSLGTAAWI